MFIFNYLNQTGLVFNLLGTLLIAISISKCPEDVYQEVKGKKIFLVALTRPKAFRSGLVLIITGFILQFINSL
jgi:hypothetical protein